MPEVGGDHQRGWGRRRLDARGGGPTDDEPARAREHLSDRGPAGDEQAPSPETQSRSVDQLQALWLLAVVVLPLALVALRALDGTTLLQQVLAAALGVCLAVGLAVRSGSHAQLAAIASLTLGVAAVATRWDFLLAGAALGTAVVAACLAVLATRPASTLPRVVLEVVIALGVGAAGGVAAAGFAVELVSDRFTYTVQILAFAAVIALVYRLAGGLHGLGRRGLVLGAGALVLLVVVLVYSAAFTQYGSPELVERVHTVQDWTRDQLGGVPHPVEVLIGVPALVWGASMRSRRRQGWWACAFGAAATGHLAADVLGMEEPVRALALSTLYDLVLGVLLGVVLIRLEWFLTGRGERRGLREGPAPALRQEPPRLRPLH